VKQIPGTQRRRKVTYYDALSGTTKMIAIILSACLANDPNVCRDYKIPIDADIDAMTCMVQAPPHFAKWAEQHPGWSVKRWHCGSASEDKI